MMDVSQQSALRPKGTDDNVKQFEQLARFMNPITGVRGSKVSSRKMGLMWMDQQKIANDLELSQDRLQKLRIEWNVAGINQEIEDLETECNK